MHKQHNRYQNSLRFDAIKELDSFKFKVPITCFATGCVSGQRDGHYAEQAIPRCKCRKN